MKRTSINPTEWGLAFAMDQGETIEGAQRIGDRHRGFDVAGGPTAGQHDRQTARLIAGWSTAGRVAAGWVADAVQAHPYC